MKKIFAVVLALVLIMGLSVTAFAAESPTGSDYFEVTLVNGSGTKGTAQALKKGEAFTSSADTAKGTFNSWTVYKADGKTIAQLGVDYTISKGSSTDAEFVIVPLSSVIVCGNYNGTVTDPITAEAKKPDSPKTGDFTALYLSLIMFGALGCGIVAKKQLAK